MIWGKCRKCKRHGFDPWVGKIPWRRKWQLTRVFLPGKFHGHRSLVGCSLWGLKELDTAEHTHMPRCFCQSLLKLMSIKSVMPSSHLILCCPLLLLPSSLPNIRVFSNESVLHIRWPKHWNFSFSISPSDEYSGLISFRMDVFSKLK